jgi:hypothetical protein
VATVHAACGSHRGGGQSCGARGGRAVIRGVTGRRRHNVARAAGRHTPRTRRDRPSSLSGPVSASSRVLRRSRAAVNLEKAALPTTQDIVDMALKVCYRGSRAQLK